MRRLAPPLSTALPVALAAAVPFGAGPALAAESPPPEPLAETGTGFTAVRLTGLGLLHRQFLENGLGWGVSGIAVYTSDWFVNAGAQGYYTLHRARNQRLYLLAGASYIQYLPSPYGIGLGLGWTLGESKGVAFSLELPTVLQFGGTSEVYGIIPVPNVAMVFNY